MQVLLDSRDESLNVSRICTFSVDDLLPMPDIELPLGVFSVSRDTLTVIYHFFEKSNAFFHSELAMSSSSQATLLYAQIRSRLLRVLGTLFRNSSFIQLSLEAAEDREQRLIPLLINDIAFPERDQRISGHSECGHKRGSNINKMSEKELLQLTLQLQESLHDWEFRPRRATSERADAIDEEVFSPRSISTARSKLENNRKKGQKESKNRRKKAERKARNVLKGKAKMDAEENESTNSTVMDDNGYKMRWSEECGYALVYLGLNRLSVQYLGSNGDGLVCYLSAVP